MVLFISGGEIFIILLAILIFFGADKIPEFARMMGKGVREFKKATDDIKREFSENTSGVLDDIKTIRDDVSDALTKEISEPVQETVNETAKTFDEYKDSYNLDYYYNNPDYMGSRGNEYHAEAQTAAVEKDAVEKAADTSLPNEPNETSQDTGQTESAADNIKTTDA